MRPAGLYGDPFTKADMKSIKPIEGVRLTGVDTLMQALAVVTD